MHFNLVDRVLERDETRIVTLKQVSMAEEYLQDHFATFPVLPGVMMLEAMVQAGRRLLDSLPDAGERRAPMVLGRVRALKYGRFVKPGASLRVEVTLHKRIEGNEFEFKGEGVVLEPAPPTAPDPERTLPDVTGRPVIDAPTAVSGRFVLRPARSGSRGEFGGYDPRPRRSQLEA